MSDAPIQQSANAFVKISSRLQMPSNNILIYSTRTAVKKAKQIQSSKMIETTIHQTASYRLNKNHNESSKEDSAFLNRYGRLRISLMQEKRRKR